VAVRLIQSDAPLVRTTGAFDLESFDLVVIGSGPAGEKGAAQAAYFGKRVAVIERSPNLGGAGVNTGTVPSKTLRESALYFSGLRQRGLYGIDYSLREGLTVQGFMHRKDAVVSAERLKIASNLAAHKIELIAGAAHFENSHTVIAVDQDGAPRSLYGEAIFPPRRYSAHGFGSVCLRRGKESV
jgi:NAD(P) transhydrogenase